MPRPTPPVRYATRLAPYFASGVRLRGLQYFESGRVRITEAFKDYVEARVRGTSLYTVTLDINGTDLICECDCSYHGLCKHIWAAVLEAEALGALEGALRVEDLALGYGEDLLPEGEAFEPTPASLPPVRTELPSPWRSQLTGLRAWNQPPSPARAEWPEARQIQYVFDITTASSTSMAPLCLTLITRDPKKNGTGWNKPKDLRLGRADIARVPHADDRNILAMLAGSRPVTFASHFSLAETLPATFELHPPLTEALLPRLFETGRVFARDQHQSHTELSPIRLDDGEPWQFELSINLAKDGGWVLDGELTRTGEKVPLPDVKLITADGTVLIGERLGRLADSRALRWVRHLRNTGRVHAPAKDGNALLAFVLAESEGIPVAVPDELSYERVGGQPQPWLRIRQTPRHGRIDSDRLTASLQFRYGEWVLSGSSGSTVFDEERRRLFVRDLAAEEAAASELQRVGVKFDQVLGDWWMLRVRLASIVTSLMGAGWRVEVDGKAFRQATGTRMEVTSGIDWFDLGGEVTYGDTSADMPALLAALRRGESVVPLADGSFGLVPEDWMARFGRIAALGETNKEAVRFSRAQTSLLDAMLAADETIAFDEGFAHARAQMLRFQGVTGVDQPSTFTGTLREYQREGLGWMEFLQQFRWGGCLADDMGLGKTAQVLALLERRRVLRTDEGIAEEHRPCGPSLVVVPKSLVFNWKAEAARFTPLLRVFDYTGAGRSRESVKDYDVVLTTYGTLRRDVPLLREIEFDYLVLDEAQAIKNAATDSAKAVRLLRGRHRLAMSGTPIENHLGELWSLFEFLNPGMLGSATAFGAAGSARRDVDEEARKLLARALRPFILRRTKQQVASELPERTEQTLWCELDKDARKMYDELRAHYRASLLGRIDKEGLNKSKMHVLEALLRLRQAACHPGLIDPERRSESSAKVDLLVEQLTEVTEEGHKALVFSQFTTLLGLVKQRLDEAGIRYEYLDGSTHDRQVPVERFQSDPDCLVFLISLKAGGLGLNLTAAEYVYLLDPWWNPAVEAQAIDRAHRIGQTRPVFAYRLIARDTVEEKVLELQRSKRELAAAIIAEDNSVVRDLKREDLELLLS